MFAKTKIALAVAIVLGTTFAASAATKSHVARADRSSASNVIPGYDKDGGLVAIPNPDLAGR